MTSKAYQALEIAIQDCKDLYKDTPEMHSVSAIICMHAIESYERNLRRLRKTKQPSDEVTK